MKVFPDGKLYIISGCPCDPDYEHTLYWPNKEGQHAYFLTKAKYRVDNMSYQRAKRGRVRVQYKVEDLYDCNYIAFQNSSFGNKWFYAFIDDVTYVNNITSEISYTIDVIQTWITEMDLQQCFVLREHSATDNVGDNLLPEDVDAGEMVAMTTWQPVIPNSPMKIVACQTTNPDGSAVIDGTFYGNTYAQAVFLKYDATSEGYSQLTQFLRNSGVLDNRQVLTSIFMCPESLLIEGTATPKSIGAVNNYLLPVAKGLKRSNGSAVKNNKLNTFPYTYLNVTNLSGQVENYAYEYFSSWGGEDHKPRFGLSKSYGRVLSLTLMPSGYKQGLSLGINFNHCLTYDSFPECAWCTDQFGNRLLIAGLSAGIGALAGGLTGGAAGAVIGGLTGAMQGYMSGGTGAASAGNIPYNMTAPVGEREDLGGKRVQGGPANERYSRFGEGELRTALALAQTQVKPLNPVIHAGSGNDLFNSGNWGFYYAQMQPLPEYIDRIDDYFSRYGYTTNKLKVPNISSRPQWNFVKTADCKIGGSIPCTDEAEICSIFNKGVTFWKHPENVCNYSLDNSPT